MDGKSKRGSGVWNSILKATDVLKEGFQIKIGDGNTSIWYEPWVFKQWLCELVWAMDIHDLELRIKDIFIDGEWQLERLYTILPEEARTVILSHKPRLVEGLQDHWTWNPCSTGVYSTNIAYKWPMRDDWQGNPGMHWSWIWKMHLPVNIQFFIWQFCHSALPTRATLVSRGIGVNQLCPRRGAIQETTLHCLFTCATVRVIWQTCFAGVVTEPTEDEEVNSWLHDHVKSTGLLIPIVM